MPVPRLTLFAYMLAIVFTVAVVIIVARFLGYGVEVVHNATEEIVSSLTSSYTVTLNESEVDLASRLTPFTTGLQYIAFFALLIVVVAVFMHTRRRE